MPAMRASAWDGPQVPHSYSWTGVTLPRMGSTIRHDSFLTRTGVEPLHGDADQRLLGRLALRSLSPIERPSFSTAPHGIHRGQIQHMPGDAGADRRSPPVTTVPAGQWNDSSWQRKSRGPPGPVAPGRRLVPEAVSRTDPTEHGPAPLSTRDSVLPTAAENHYWPRLAGSTPANRRRSTMRKSPAPPMEGRTGRQACLRDT
jgi:hypothetical protein